MTVTVTTDAVHVPALGVLLESKGVVRLVSETPMLVAVGVETDGVGTTAGEEEEEVPVQVPKAD